MKDSVLNLKKVCKNFGTKQVLRSVDFEVKESTIMGLVGKNGAGKTTMIKCLLGLLRPDEGEAAVFNEDPWNLNGEIKHRIGYVPQTLVGFRWMKTGNLLEYTGSFYSKWNTEKVNLLISEWGLDANSRISALSEGERQKLSIILAMGHEPDLLVLDEPVASLDPSARRQFLKQLIEINSSSNKTVLFSTHIMSDLERVAAEVSILRDGVISYAGDLASLKDRIRRVHFQSDKNLPENLPVKNIIHSRMDAKNATLIVDGLNEEEIRNTGSELSAFVTIEYLNLEEIFLELHR